MLHLKFIAIGGVVWIQDPLWGVLIATTVLSGSQVMILGIFVTLLRGTRRLEREIARVPIWNRSKLKFDRFDDVLRKPLGGAIFRTPQADALVPASPHDQPLEPEAYPNAFGPSVMLLPVEFNSPLENLKRLQRFTIYHELSHCSFPGTLIWNSRYVASYSYVAAILAAALLYEIPPWISTSCTILLSWLLFAPIWSAPRKVAAELHADSQALVWISQDSLMDAIAVCENRMRVWSKSSDETVRARRTNIQRWARYFSRLADGKFAIQPRIEGHAFPYPVLQYIGAVAVFFGMARVTDQYHWAVVPLIFVTLFVAASAFVAAKIVRSRCSPVRIVITSQEFDCRS